jgi:hypothetical protein
MDFKTFLSEASGGQMQNHHQTVVQTAPIVWPQHCLTIVPLGEHSPQHNQTMVKSTARPRITANHNQTLRIVR